MKPKFELVFTKEFLRRLEQLDKNEKLRGLMFFPKTGKSEGYTIRAPADRQTVQIVLPKPIRPIFDQENLYGIYAGKISEHEDQSIVTVRFENE